MAFYFYVLRSEKTGRLYKGHCKDPDLRLKQHNAGKTRSTKGGTPWLLVYKEAFDTREDAIEREKLSKTPSGGRELKKLLARAED